MRTLSLVSPLTVRFSNLLTADKGTKYAFAERGSCRSPSFGTDRQVSGPLLTATDQLLNGGNGREAGFALPAGSEVQRSFMAAFWTDRTTTVSRKPVLTRCYCHLPFKVKVKVKAGSQGQSCDNIVYTAGFDFPETSKSNTTRAKPAAFFGSASSCIIWF